MANNTIGGIPATIVFTLIVSFFAFFASVTCVTLYYYKRDPRRLERLRQLEQAIEDRETTFLGNVNWVEMPIIWEVWADKHPKRTSKWEDLLPLNLTYEQDLFTTRGLSLHRTPAVPAPRSTGTGWGSRGGVMGDHTQTPETDEGLRSHLDTPNCNLSVFIAMPSPHEHLPPEFGGEYAIGTARVLYPHPERLHL